MIKTFTTQWLSVGIKEMAINNYVDDVHYHHSVNICLMTHATHLTTTFYSFLNISLYFIYSSVSNSQVDGIAFRSRKRKLLEKHNFSSVCLNLFLLIFIEISEFRVFESKFAYYSPAASTSQQLGLNFPPKSNVSIEV